MRLHEDKTLFRQAVRFTAQEMKIKDIYVEKDYWVCFVLDQIFKQEYKDYILFKGGTSLTKCYDLLERFSEDIDLVVLRAQGESEMELISKRDSISEMAQTFLPEVYVEEFTKSIGPNNMIEEYELWPVPVKVLDPTRTICDKIMSLVRMSHMDNPIESFKGKIRHIYDLNMLLQQKDFYDFFGSSKLDGMMKDVIHQDRISYDNIRGYMDKHPKDALLFSDIDDVWLQISSTYNGSFADLVYGKLPEEDEILETLRVISNRLSRLTWPPH